MLTNRNAVLACVMLASFSGCGGRSGLDDFANGADNLIPGSRGGAKLDNDSGATNGGGGGDAGDAAVGAKEDAGPVEPGPAERGAVGAQCMGDKACNGATATCLTEIPVAMGLPTRFPNGYCTVQDCATDDDCAANGACVAAYGAMNCLQRCDEESDCRTEDGYECGTPEAASDPGTYCIPVAIDPRCLLCPDAKSMVRCTKEMKPGICFGGGGGQGGGGNRGGN